MYVLELLVCQGEGEKITQNLFGVPYSGDLFLSLDYDYSQSSCTHKHFITYSDIKKTPPNYCV